MNRFLTGFTFLERAYYVASLQTTEIPQKLKKQTQMKMSASQDSGFFQGTLIRVGSMGHFEGVNMDVSI